MDLKRLTNRAKGLVEKRGGTEAVKQDADELKKIARGPGSLSEKAKAAAAALKEPGSAAKHPGAGAEGPGGAEEPVADTTGPAVEAAQREHGSAERQQPPTGESAGRSGRRSD